MDRTDQFKKLAEKNRVWDIVVIGGGATGLGVAVDAAARGLSVALIEKSDFAKCTSSRSTKLVHGGVRYLQKGDVLPVLEALRERGRMKANAPHLTAREILFKHVLNNRLLWFIAIANAFVYMVRYGCLDWAPTFLRDAQGYDIKQAGWAYFAYEFAAIPGTLFCGWLSDKVFHGRRALPTILFMAIVAVFIFLYWQFSANYVVVTLSLIAIGFFIYGPVMLIGVQALDLASKNAAGTAAGLTGFFGYFLGTAILANIVIGSVAEKAGWDWTFILLIAACFLAIVFMALTYKEEKNIHG